MPLCEKCGKPYALSREDEHLLLRGLIAPVCDECGAAPKLGQFSQGLVGKKDDGYPTTDIANLAGVELLSAWYIDSEDSRKMFVSRPRRSIKQTTPLARPRRMAIPVNVITEGASMGSNTPPVRLQTNLLNFQSRGRAFWVKKIPAFCDDHTGIDHIEVPQDEVERIERTSRWIVNVYLKNGYHVQLTFASPDDQV